MTNTELSTDDNVKVLAFGDGWRFIRYTSTTTVVPPQASKVVVPEKTGIKGWFLSESRWTRTYGFKCNQREFDTLNQFDIGNPECAIQIVIDSWTITATPQNLIEYNLTRPPNPPYIYKMWCSKYIIGQSYEVVLELDWMPFNAKAKVSLINQSKNSCNVMFYKVGILEITDEEIFKSVIFNR